MKENNNFRRTYPYRIPPQAVDFRLRITLTALTDILMNTAGINADENGFGMRQLQKIDCSWVLMRFAVEMQRFPEQYEEITVETWIEDISRLTSTRNFCIRDAQENIIGYAISIWTMIDFGTRRPKDLMTLDKIQDFSSGESIPMDKPVKLGATENISPEETFRAKYSHIDFNQHVNTMRYLEWLGNQFSLDHYKQFEIERCDIQFINEIYFDDEISVYKQRNSDEIYSLELVVNEKPACRARFKFRPENRN